jgi:hypothetical protein
VEKIEDILEIMYHVPATLCCPFPQEWELPYGRSPDCSARAWSPEHVKLQRTFEATLSSNPAGKSPGWLYYRSRELLAWSSSSKSPGMCWFNYSGIAHWPRIG